MTEPSNTRDIFDKARSVAAAFLVAAGAAVLLGTVLDWVTVKPPPIIPIEQEPALEPFTGLETKSAPYLVIMAGAVIILALLMVTRKKLIYAWGAFLCSIVIGAIAFQNYRGIDELFYEQMQRIGDPSPALGLTLVAAGGVIGVIAGAAGASAIPPDKEEAE